MGNIEVMRLKVAFYDAHKDKPPTEEETAEFERELKRTKNKEHSKYQTEYARAHYKRIVVQTTPEEKARIKKAATAAGISVNAFCLDAIREKAGL